MGIDTSKFYIGEKVKLFGVTRWTTPGVTQDTTRLECVRCTAEAKGSVGTPAALTHSTYNYWVSQYDLKDGRVGVSSITDNGVGVVHKNIGDLNGADFITLSLNRSSINNGLLIYRQIQSSTATTATRTQARLIAILGPKELGNSTTTDWKDYGEYNKTTWAKKGEFNEFLPSDSTGDNAIWDTPNLRAAEGSVNPEHQIHFPNIPTNNGLHGTFEDGTSFEDSVVNNDTNYPDEGNRRGWEIDEIVGLGKHPDVEGHHNRNEPYIVVSQQYDYNGNVGFGTTSAVKVVHDNTAAFRKAVAGIQTSGSSYLSIPSGTYYTDELLIPSNFTLTGQGKNSIIKKQFFGNDEKDGYGPSGSAFTDATTGGVDLTSTGNFVGIGTTMASAKVSPKDVTISNITFDGNNHNNILFGDSNYMVYCKDAQSTLIKDVELRNSTGDGLYLDGSVRVSVENSTIVDGCLLDSLPFKPLIATGSTSTRVNDSLFENYPGSVDVSGSTVVSTGGNIIRNCGAGLDAYATGKITTTNNILLGPSDEWLPSPDIYDSDWNSINVNIPITNTFTNGTLDPQVDFISPDMLYVEDGSPKDISPSKVTISIGIGTILDLGATQSSLGAKFLTPTIDTPVTQNDGIDMEHGYFRFKVTGAQINDNLSQIVTNPNTGLGERIGISSAYGYEVVGTEFLDKPVGYSTYIGISTGKWGTMVYNDSDSAVADRRWTVGTANTCYWVHLSDPNQLNGVAVDDIVQLVDHEASPSLVTYKFIVEEKKITTGIGTVRLRPVKVFGSDTAAFPVYPVTITGGETDSNRTAGTYEVTSGITTTRGGSATTNVTPKVFGSEFSVFVNTAGTATVTITSCGTGHLAGDIITIANSQIGGGADLQLTVGTIDDKFDHPADVNTPANGLKNGQPITAASQKAGYISIKRTFVIAKGRVGVS